MKNFGKILIILTFSIFGLSKGQERKSQTFNARKLLSTDYCTLSCDSAKNIACEVGGKCEAKEPCKFDAIDKTKILDAHNKLRHKFASGEDTHSGGITVANMMAVGWDKDLAFTASCNLAKCGGMAHDQCRVTPKFPKHAGQNLWTYMTSAEDGDCIGESIKGVEQWYDEIKDLNPGQLKSSGEHYASVSGTGHFTQVIWAEVTHIGCSLTKNKEGGRTSCFMACNYGPGGNMIGASMFKEGKPCSQCPDGVKCGSTYASLCGEGGVGDGDGEADGKSAPADPRPNIGLLIVLLMLFHTCLVYGS